MLNDEQSFIVSLAAELWTSKDHSSYIQNNRLEESRHCNVAKVVQRTDDSRRSPRLGGVYKDPEGSLNGKACMGKAWLPSGLESI